MDLLQSIAPHSILSNDLCFGPHDIIKQTTKNDFQKKIDNQKLIWMIKPFFENFLKFVFMLETKLEMIGTIILYRK